MSNEPHTYAGPAYLLRMDSDRQGATYVKLAAYTVDTYFRLTWLPRMLETDLIVAMIKDGDPWPAVYHPGTASYTAEAIAHLAGIAATIAQKKQSNAEAYLAGKKLSDLTKEIINDYNRIRQFPTKGYYQGGKLVWEGRAVRSELLTDSQFRNFLVSRGWAT
jgi:hypothetical protein